jgi:hypothetical protein
MTGREVMEMVDTLDRGAAEIARLRALNRELLDACMVAERVFRVQAGTDKAAEVMALAVLRCAIRAAKAGQC